MGDKFQNQYRIPSARAIWHDYNGGAYFVTICTKNREHFFGEIENSIMQLTAIGQFLKDLTGS
jgi:REP element-mobilizing transposase RayT